MPSGTVKKVVKERGFGFICPDHGDAKGSGKKGDVFFHCSALPENDDIDDLNEGNRVSYEIVAGDDGRERAVNVRVL